jgi:hypothetical protein
MNTPLITAGHTGQSGTVFTSLAALPRRSRWGGDLFVMATALAAVAAFVAPIQHNAPATTTPTPIFSTPDHCLAAVTAPAAIGAAQDASCAWPAFTGPAELPWSAPTSPVLLTK